MARKTVGELVDDILSAMDSDPVTLYDDTEESRQVAQILETTYYNLIDGKDWPNLYTMFQLTQTSAATPCHMTIPTGIMDLQYVKYNVRTIDDVRDKYLEIKFLEPKDFMMMLDARDSSAANITQITSTIYYNFYNDRAPTFYTSLNETTAIFDAFDTDVETFLKTIKTQCYGKTYPTVTMADGFYFDLPPDAFSLLLAEAKATCFQELKQVANPKAEQHAVTQRRRMSQEAWKIRNGITYPNYGRRGHK
jgi:hypothetical protein